MPGVCTLNAADVGSRTEHTTIVYWHLFSEFHCPLEPKYWQRHSPMFEGLEKLRVLILGT